jgi:hypothetical protein
MNPLSFKRLGYIIGVMASVDSIAEKSKPKVEAKDAKPPALEAPDSVSGTTSVSEVYVRGIHIINKHDKIKTVGNTL